jgi:long-chain acyl-CoA synthetase
VPKDNKTVGEVIVKAPGKCAYDYINKPEEARESTTTTKDGFISGAWNERKYVTIVGRKDE